MVNALKEIYDLVTVCDIPMIFTCCRVDRKTVPKGLHVYDVRHDDDCQGIPCQIKEFILVNHWGTIISTKPLKLDEKWHDIELRIDEKHDEWLDWNYEGASLTLDEYIKEYS